MSIIVAGWIDFEPSVSERLIREAKLFIDETLAETGCGEYAWALDPSHPGRVRVFELWDSEADLAAHFAHPSFLAMRKHLQTAKRLASDIHKYHVDMTGPVFDSQGRHRADFFTEPS